MPRYNSARLSTEIKVGAAIALGVIALAVIGGAYKSRPSQSGAAVAGQAIADAANGALAIRGTMRDPDSFKLASMLIVPKTGTVCYEYRAKNGFGGTDVG